LNLVVVTLSPGFIVNRPEMRRGCLAEVSCALATTLDLSHYRRASAVQSARSGSSRGCQASPQIEICIELGTIVERFRRLRERLRHHALARTSRTRVDVLWPAKGQPQVPTNVDRWWGWRAALPDFHRTDTPRGGAGGRFRRPQRWRRACFNRQRAAFSGFYVRLLHCAKLLLAHPRVVS
jgi:hypothetical protein